MNRREMLTCGLAEELVRRFGEVRLRVFGTSMLPSIFPGDLIYVQRAAISEISSGEIVLYSRQGRLFAHRVIACGGSAAQPLLITRGDRLRHDDSPVSSSELLGRVTSVGRGEHYVKPSAQASKSNEPLLRLLQLSDRATYVYLRLTLLWRILFPRRVACRG